MVVVALLGAMAVVMMTALVLALLVALVLAVAVMMVAVGTAAVARWQQGPVWDNGDCQRWQQQ